MLRLSDVSSPPRLERLLLLDHQPRVISSCAHALEELGYARVLYRDYTRSGGVPAGMTVDAVVAVWADRQVHRQEFLTAVMGTADLPGVRGALVVSPFSTPENAQLLRRCGARAWLRSPFSNRQLDTRLRFLLDGDRRQQAEPVEIDRRHEPVFPLAIPA